MRKRGRRHAARDVDRLTWRDVVVWVGIPLLVVLLVRLFVVGVYVIPSGSMLDTVQIGDRVVASRLTPRFFAIRRGDVIVFKDPANWLGDERGTSTRYLIKRVIGLPGDTVACAGAGEPVTINGHPVDERGVIRGNVNPSDYAFSVTVTEGHLFVMGDNRPNSADSRVHQQDGANGLVPVDDVVGVALAVYWPISDWSSLARPEGVYDHVGGVSGVR